MLFAASAFGRLPLESAINTRVCYNLSLAFGLPNLDFEIYKAVLES